MRAQDTRRGGKHCLEQRGGLEHGEQTSNSTTVDQAPMPFHPAVCSIAELIDDVTRLALYAPRARLPRLREQL